MIFTEKLSKYFLVILNLVVIVCGIVLTIYGGYVLSTENKGLPRFTEFSIGGLAIAVGVIIFLISILGLYGAIKENNCLLTIYLVVLVTVLILQIVLAVYAFIFRDDDSFAVEKVVEKVFNSEIGSGSSSTQLIDDIQQDFKCCGVLNSGYWTVLKGIEIPDSCHVNKDKNLNVFGKGCVRAFRDAVNDNIVVLAGVALAFVIIEIFGIVAALVLKKVNDKEFYRSSRY